MFEANKQIASRGWRGVQRGAACPEAVLCLSQGSKMKVKCHSFGHPFYSICRNSVAACDTVHHWPTSLVNQWLYRRFISLCCKLLLGSCVLLQLKSGCVLSPAGALISERGPAPCPWPEPWPHLASVRDSPVVILMADVFLKYDNGVLLKNQSSSTTWCSVLLHFEQWHKIDLKSLRRQSSLVPLQHNLFYFFLNAWIKWLCSPALL